MTEIRIDVVKNALQLSPEQTKYWPAIEEAIRARAEMRRQRLENVAERMDEPQPDRDFVKIMQNHAAVLTERGTALRRLADAWQPLYSTLNDTQKRRMRILAVVVLHGAREDLEDRPSRMEARDARDVWGAATGPGSGESGSGALKGCLAALGASTLKAANYNSEVRRGSGRWVQLTALSHRTPRAVR